MGLPFTFDCAVSVEPMSVAIRDEDRATVRFECSFRVPDSKQEVLDRGSLSAWATYGQRKRLPARVRVERDRVDGPGLRIAVVAVDMPPDYSACTLHVSLKEGGRAWRRSRRVVEDEFRRLAPVCASAQNNPAYPSWFDAHRADRAQLERQRATCRDFPIRPLMSIVTPVFRTPAAYLRECIASVLGQTYDNLELVIVNVSGDCPEVDGVLAEFDDARLRVVEVPNRSIPENTNVGIEQACGDYVGFVDHDDFVEPDALYRYAEAINARPETDLLFCDEDLWLTEGSAGRYAGARLKPGWNPDLLFTHNYVCHLLMVSRWALEWTDRSGPDMNGAQDYDLTLKVAEIARGIQHVPHVLYHWREHPLSTARNRGSKPYILEAGQRAVQAHFDRVGVPARVGIGESPMSYQVQYRDVAADDVSIVLLEGAGIAAHALDQPALAPGGGVEVIVGDVGAPNAAVRTATRPFVVMLDSSAGAIDAQVVDGLARQLGEPGVGCSAPLLVDGSGQVLSAGFAMGSDGTWLHTHRGYPHDDYGYMTLLVHAHDAAAVPLRCLAFRKADFERLGGFDPAFEGDRAAIDFCLRLRDAGLRTAVVPSVHVEVAGPLPDLPSGSISGRLPEGDPYFNPQLDQSSGAYVL